MLVGLGATAAAYGAARAASAAWDKLPDGFTDAVDQGIEDGVKGLGGILTDAVNPATLFHGWR